MNKLQHLNEVTTGAIKDGMIVKEMNNDTATGQPDDAQPLLKVASWRYIFGSKTNPLQQVTRFTQARAGS